MSLDHPSPISPRQQSLFETSDDLPPIYRHSRPSDRPGRVWSRCWQCEVEFEHIRSWPHKRCDECRSTVFLPLDERATLPGNTGIEQRTCPICGVEFVAHVSKKKVCCSHPCGTLLQRKNAEESGGPMPGRKKTGREVPCEVCAKTTYVKPYQVAKGHGRFCSTECQNIWQARDSVISTCEWCDGPMTMSPFRSQTQRFCSFPCQAEGRRKQFLERTHNGKRVYQNKQGYIYVWEPDHPKSAIYKKWYPEHRLVVEKSIGRVLESDEVVHHIDSVKYNNALSNLRIMDPTSHRLLTLKELREKRKAEKAELARLVAENAELRARLASESEVAR